MTDVMYAFRKPQIGKESTSGTAVTPSKVLGSLEIAPSPAPVVAPFRPMGYLVNSVGATNYEQTNAPVRGQGDYQEAPYWLASLLHDTTPTTPGGATNAREWQFYLSTDTEHTPATYTCEVGSTRRAALMSYLLFGEMGYTVNFQQGMQLTGNAFARKLTDDKTFYVAITGGTPTSGTWSMTVNGQTATGLSRTITAGALQTALEALSNVAPGDVVATGGPLGTTTITLKWAAAFAEGVQLTISTADTFDAGDVTVTRLAPGATSATLQPILGSQFDFYTAATFAGLAGASALTRCFGFNFRLGGRWAPIQPMNTSNNGSFAAHGEPVPESQVGFTVGADSNGMAYLSTLRQNSKLFFRAKATGGTVETGQTYLFQQDMCVLLTNVQPINEGAGLAQITFEGQLLHDSTWGRSLGVLVRNSLASL